MSDRESEIVSGLVFRIVPVLLVAVIDEYRRTFTIRQQGEAQNGSLAAIERVKARLAARVSRTRPDLRAE